MSSKSTSRILSTETDHDGDRKDLNFAHVSCCIAREWSKAGFPTPKEVGENELDIGTDRCCNDEVVVRSDALEHEYSHIET